jgi:lipoyl synthase
MSEFKGIPILTGAAAPAAEAGQAVPEADRPARSGEKYRTPQGFTAIKDGIKSGGSAGTGVPAAGSGAGPVGGGTASVGSGTPALRKPSWLKAPMALGSGFSAVKSIVREHRLSTVCEEAKCPNIGECWNAGTATIMLMGAVCTRACRFCAVDTGNPRGWLDPEEPENVARSVELMRLKYVVLTSVDRDDLPDGGAAHYAAAIRAIKARNPGTAVEALTPDFSGVSKDVRTVMDSGLDVFAQNVETVERLTHPVRDPRAGYRQTLDVLGEAKAYRPAVLTKTSLMLGLGETDEEIRKTLEDLRAVSVDLLTLGQYLRPTPNHLAVERFVTPEQFEMYRRWALDLGFLECVSGPLVRSSYRAEQALARNNAGLERGLRRPITPAKV